MKKTLLTLLFIVALVMILSADLNKMWIIGRAEKTGDLVDFKYQTVNRERAACIIILTDLEVDLDFEPNVERVGLFHDKPGEWCFYIAPGEVKINIYAAGYEPLIVFLRDVGIRNIQSNDVYQLRLTGDKKIIEKVDDKDLFTVEFNIQPKDVYVSHNNNVPTPVRGDKGQFRLPAGKHRFVFSKQGYADKSVDLDVNSNSNQYVILEKGTSKTELELQGYVVVDSDPPGAEFYLNEQMVGRTPYQGEFVAGNYNYRLSLPLHTSHTGSFTLRQGGNVHIPKIKLESRFGTLTIDSTPSGAEVYVNNGNRGTTPTSKMRMDSGEYDLEIRLHLHLPHREKFQLKSGEDKKINVNLKPAFAELVINSSPEQGAKVFIDDQEVGVTPYRNNRHPFGSYVVRLEKESYSPVTKQIEIQDERGVRENMELLPTFGKFTIISEGAEIFIDNRSVGRDKYQTNLPQGRYTVTAKKERHIDAEEDIFVQAGEARELKLTPAPRQGAVSIISQPFATIGADIYINGDEREEKTPNIIRLFPGRYNITLKHRDFFEQTKFVDIREQQTEKLEFNMKPYNRDEMRAKRRFWKTNKWVGFATTALVLGGGVYFDWDGHKRIDDFHNSTTESSEINALEKSEASFRNRDMCYYVSIAPAAYTLFSWIKQASCNSKIKKMK